MEKILLVGAGGMIGSIARYLTARGIDVKMQAVFPYGTLSVNLIGSFLIGIIYAFALRKPETNEHFRLFFGTGFCGGFTTFSAFALENVNLLDQKNFVAAGTYIFVTLVAGIAAVMAGIVIGKNFFH